MKREILGTIMEMLGLVMLISVIIVGLVSATAAIIVFTAGATLAVGGYALTDYVERHEKNPHTKDKH